MEEKKRLEALHKILPDQPYQGTNFNTNMIGKDKSYLAKSRRLLRKCGLTDAELKALKWLENHNRYGLWIKGKRVIMSQGQIAPVMRSTWSNLIKKGWLEEDTSLSGAARITFSMKMTDYLMDNTDAIYAWQVLEESNG